MPLVHEFKYGAIKSTKWYFIYKSVYIYEKFLHERWIVSFDFL